MHMCVCAHSHVPLRELAFEIKLELLGPSGTLTLVYSRLSLSQGA